MNNKIHPVTPYNPATLGTLVGFEGVLGRSFRANGFGGISANAWLDFNPDYNLFLPESCVTLRTSSAIEDAGAGKFDH